MLKKVFICSAKNDNSVGVIPGKIVLESLPGGENYESLEHFRQKMVISCIWVAMTNELVVNVSFACPFSSVAIFKHSPAT